MRTFVAAHGKRAVLVLAVLLYAALLARSIWSAAGGSDSSGYCNAARLIARGNLHVRVTPLDTLHLDDSWRDIFVPLGFSVAPEPKTMVPFYPLGLPFHLVPFGMIGGWRHAPFFLMPMVALLTLWVTWKLARELGLSAGYALTAAFLLALAPTFVYQAVQPMSDVLATFWCTATILFAVRSQRDVRWAAACGAAFGIAVWVRPSNLLLVPAVGLALLLGGQRPAAARVRGLAIAVAASVPFAIGLMILNRSLYGSPFSTGYPADIVSLSYLRTHLAHYSKWMALLESPVVFPGALLLLFARGVAGWLRATLTVWFAAFFAFYCFYGPYETWWYTRFLLPAFPAILIATMLVLRAFVPRRAIAAVLVCVIAIAGIWGQIHFDLADLHDGERIYPDAVHWAEKQLPPDALVCSMQLGGTFRYYADRFTVRYDLLEPDRFEELRAYAGVAGKRWYAVLFSWEEKNAFARMPGRWTKVSTIRDVSLWRLDS